MKVMTILGTRPEIIRLSRVIPLLDASVEHVLVHTGQNYDDRLSRRFFDELGIRAPDELMGVRAGSAGEQIGLILHKSEQVLLRHRPDRLLILGDTNSGLSAIIARRLGVPVYHMEAGNRCYDDRVPEEVNRRVIDHSSSVLMPYTQRSRENLLREGIAGERIFVIGNPIKEVMDWYREGIAESPVIKAMELQRKGYFLVTMHRAENVDAERRLRSLVTALARVARRWSLPVVCSLHPRTRERIASFGVDVTQVGLKFVEPFGFADFVALEQNACCILSDSGTVQEEACILGVPNVTIRDVTERPETVEAGSNVLSGVGPGEIERTMEFVMRHPPAWKPPQEYLAERVSETVGRIVLSFRVSDAAETAWQERTL